MSISEYTQWLYDTWRNTPDNKYIDLEVLVTANLDKLGERNVRGSDIDMILADLFYMCHLQ
jgi:hypothetical protein